MRGAFAIVVLVLSGAISVGAVAMEPSRDGHLLLQRGLKLHREAAYAASVAALEQARQVGGLDGAEQAECGFYLAADYVAMGSLDAARRELRAVLEVSPAYELPQYTSPKVTALYNEVKDELQKLPKLKALPPRRREARVELWFELARAGGMAFGAARWRWRGEREFREAPLGHPAGSDERMLAVLTVDRAGTIEYFAEARGPAGAAQVGSPEQPLELPVAGSLALTATPPEQRKKSIAGAWWLWTTVGAVVAAGVGVGLYFALRPPAGGTADAVLNFQVR